MIWYKEKNLTVTEYKFQPEVHPHNVPCLQIFIWNYNIWNKYEATWRSFCEFHSIFECKVTSLFKYLTTTATCWLWIDLLLPDPPGSGQVSLVGHHDDHPLPRAVSGQVSNHRAHVPCNTSHDQDHTSGALFLKRQRRDQLWWW